MAPRRRRPSPAGHSTGRVPHHEDYRFDRYYGPRDEPDYNDRDYRDRAGYFENGRRRSRTPPLRRYDTYSNIPNDSGYSFRGAADRHPPQRQEERFTFRSQGPQAPRFPSPERHPLPTRPRAPRPQSSSHIKFRLPSKPQTHRKEAARPASERSLLDTGRSPSDTAPVRRGGPNLRQRGGHRRGGFKAHTRDILRGRRGSTPEQLAGMNPEGHARFTTVDSSEDEEIESDQVNNGDGPRKRIKIEPSAPDVAAPMWSNPDPYTSLPPASGQDGPKKDIVRLIRKAKIDASKSDSENAVKDNLDFISLNDASEEGEASDDYPTIGIGGPNHLGEQKMPRTPELRTSRRGQRQNSPSPAPSSLGSLPHPIVYPERKKPTKQYVEPKRYGTPRAEQAKDKKRKRVRDQHEVSILPEWEDTDQSDPTPWFEAGATFWGLSVAERLHAEIEDFYQFVQPRDFETAVREDLINRVQVAVQGCPNINQGGRMSRIKSFGSFASGLHLPVADMDLVAVSPRFLNTGNSTIGQSNTQIRAVGRFIEAEGLAKEGTMALVLHAKVPLVKFVDKQTGIKVDISFDNGSGLVANQTIKNWIAKYPALPKIVMVIKQLLAMYGLNEVFTGGLGGFSIVCLVVSMLQIHPRLAKLKDTNLTDLLLNFLNIYGNEFNIHTTGINLDPPRHFYKSSAPSKKQNPDTLTIIDPNNSENDISGGSRSIKLVLECFSDAYKDLSRRLKQVNDSQDDKGSILGCILRGNYSSFVKQRRLLKEIYNDWTSIETENE